MNKKSKTFIIIIVILLIILLSLSSFCSCNNDTNISQPISDNDNIKIQWTQTKLIDGYEFTFSKIKSINHEYIIVFKSGCPQRFQIMEIKYENKN